MRKLFLILLMDIKMKILDKYIVHHADEELNQLIDKRKSFILNVLDKNLAVSVVEDLIEQKGMSCRVYTENRLREAFFPKQKSPWFIPHYPTNPNAGLSILKAFAIGAHNLVTWNPDYEIGKDPVEEKITVTYKKGNL
jgi:hypothetical protein